MLYQKVNHVILHNCHLCTGRYFKFYQCRQCKYILCIKCYHTYINNYQFQHCPHCRIEITIVNDQTDSQLGILVPKKKCHSNSCLNCILRYILVASIIIMCYFLGYIVTNKHHSFPMLNIMYGMLILVTFFMLLLFCCNIIIPFN